MRGLAVALLLIVGCGSAATSSRSSSAAPEKCTSVYDGKHRLTEAEKGSCVLADGTLFITGYVDHKCKDGSTIGWNDAGWWRDGIGYPHLAELKTAPQAEIDRCLPPP